MSEESHKYYIANKERILIRTRNYYSQNKERYSNLNRKWFNENRQQGNEIAYAYVERNRAKHNARTSALYHYPVRQVCSIEDCGELGERHHEDYTKPAEIIWLCERHHLEREKLISADVL